MIEQPTEVLVAGAGPAGLTTAYELARRGIAVRLIDAAPGPSKTSRALATHARTLEIYDQMGVLEQILARGRASGHFTMHRKGRRLVRFGPEYSELATRFPFTLLIDQSRTEEVLRAAVDGLGLPIEWGVRLTGVQPGADDVGVTLTDATGKQQRLRVPWLVGCDGGHSTVRKDLGLKLIGSSSETWLIADALVDTDLPDDSLHWLHAAGGTTMAVPFADHGKWRLLDTVDVTPQDADDPEAVAARFSAKLTAGSGRPTKVHTPSWVSVFTIQQRMIQQMRAGRCFVAGDAAHVHSPASGQGMNTGIQDAFNLGWKLAEVVRGEASADLLDSYGAERVPVGATLLEATKRATALVGLRETLSSAALPVAFGVIRNVPALQHKIERKIMRGMTALALSYPDSPLTWPAPAGPGPSPGERVAQVREPEAASTGWQELLAELRDVRWTLLAFGPAAAGPAAELAAANSDWLSVRTVGGDATATGPLPDPDGVLWRSLHARDGGWALIRPDGYLSTRGERLDAGSLSAVPLHTQTEGAQAEKAQAERAQAETAQTEGAHAERALQ
jgi:NADPH-dependent dioxygenase